VIVKGSLVSTSVAFRGTPKGPGPPTRKSLPPCSCDEPYVRLLSATLLFLLAMKIYGRYLIIISRLDGSISLACII